MNSIRDNVIDAVRTYFEDNDLLRHGSEDAIQEVAKEVADAVFDALGIPESRQDLGAEEEYTNRQINTLA